MRSHYIIIVMGALIGTACNDNNSTSDTDAPFLSEITAVPAGASATPSYTFNSTKAGAIVYGGDCSSATTNAVAGDNTIIFNTLSDGIHSDCTLMVEDASGKISTVLVVSRFFVDSIIPVISQVTAVIAPTRTFTPSYTFNTTESGRIIYAGDCSSSTASAVIGDNTIRFNTLLNGTYSNCTIQVADAVNTSLSLAVPAFTVEAKWKPLNDTGYVNCGDYAYTDNNEGSDAAGLYNVTGSGNHDNNLDCSIQPTVPTQTTDGFDSDGDIIRAGQDVHYGRDATNNNDSDGLAGFNFTKLDSNGAALPASAASWSCIKDNVTGLIWEAKTDDGGLQDKDHTYTWYNSSGTNDGGSAGTPDDGVCTGVTGCDTEKYVADINASNSGTGICGANDWGLPSLEELRSIVHYGKISPAIDSGYFPNIQANNYWSSLPLASTVLGYLDNNAWTINFDDGDDHWVFEKTEQYYVRLVHRNQ